MPIFGDKLNLSQKLHQKSSEASECPILKVKILVLGAGVAGLGAAQALITQGMSVTVLEGRDRIGGRTVTN